MYEEEGSNGPNVSADIAKMPENLGLFARFGYSNKNTNIYGPKKAKRSKKKYFEVIENEILEEMKSISEKHSNKDDSKIKRDVKATGNLAVGHTTNFLGGKDSTEGAKRGIDLLRTLRKYSKGEHKTEKGA